MRVYPPTTPPGMIPNGAGLVWAHGGGFAGGDLDMPEADGVARALAARGVTVVSVDYALAPTPPAWAESLGLPSKDGVHYPAASDDVIAAFRWAFESELVPGPVGARRCERRRQSGDRRHPAPARRRRPAALAGRARLPDAARRAARTGCRAPGRARRRPRGRHVRTRRRARNVRELPRRAGRRRAAPRDPGTGDRRRPRALPADAHDQRRGRRTPRLGRALRRAPSPPPAATSSRSPSPAPGTATSTVPKNPGRGIPRSHRRPPRRLPPAPTAAHPS